jgi:hypothetical protein
VTIRALHSASAGVSNGMKQFKAISVAFAAAFVQKIAAQYAQGLVYDWHFFTWLFIWSDYKNKALVVENWGWFLELSPQYWGMGMLVGLNTGASIFLGAFLFYAILGPILVSTGVCKLTPAAPAAAGPEWAGYMSYVGAPGTPYMWIIWPGLAVLICSTVTEICLQLPGIFKAARLAAREAKEGLLKRFHHRGTTTGYDPYDGPSDSIRHVQTSETIGKDVPTWLWVVGILVVTAVACIIAQVQWKVNPGWEVLAILISCFFGVLK